MCSFQRVLLLPVGSYEYHGGGLSPTTDTVIATRIASAVANIVQDSFKDETVVLPPLPYGLSAEHRGLPTTAFVRHCTYYKFLMELVESLASPGTLIVIVNAHGGNIHTSKALEADFNYEHETCKVFAPSLYSGPIPGLCEELLGEFDAHAGSVEASLMAFYEEKEQSCYEIEIKTKMRGLLRFFRTIHVAPNGVIKQSTQVVSDPNKGEKIHEAIASRLAESIPRLADDLSAHGAGGKERCDLHYIK